MSIYLWSFVLKRFPLMVLYMAILVVVAGGATAYGVFSKTVDLTVDGKTQTVRTFGGDVQDVLDSKSIRVGSDDVVSPDPSTSVGDGEDITVKYARPLSVSVDGVTTSKVTYEATVADALEKAGVAPHDDAYLSQKPKAKIPRDGVELVVSNPKVINVKADGDTKKVRTAEPTVAEVLKAANIKVDKDDEVRAAHRTQPATSKNAKAKAAGDAADSNRVFTANKNEKLSDEDLVTKDLKIKVIRVKTLTKDEKIPVGYDVKVRDNDDLAKGKTKIVKAGVKGMKVQNVTVTTADGDIRKRKVHSTKMVRRPAAQIVERGTKKAPTSSPVGASAGVFDRLAQCESGGNWASNTGNGFYGGVQFSAQTWHSMGGSGLPSEASRAEQIQRASALQKQSGWGQWPACSQKLGLR